MCVGKNLSSQIPVIRNRVMDKAKRTILSANASLRRLSARETLWKKNQTSNLIPK